MSLLESAEALDDVLAVVPQRGRKGTLACCAVCFLKSMALHLSVGVCVDERGFRVSVPEPFGEQGQRHAGLVTGRERFTNRVEYLKSTSGEKGVLVPLGASLPLPQMHQ
jgi:hypothetical protein